MSSKILGLSLIILGIMSNITRATHSNLSEKTHLLLNAAESVLKIIPSLCRCCSADYEEVQTNEPTINFYGFLHDAYALAILSMADGKDYVFSSSKDNTIKMWDFATKNCVRSFEGHSDIPILLKVITAQRNLLVSGAGAIVNIWDIETGECLKTLAGHKTRILDIACIGERYIASSSGNVYNQIDNIIIIWDINSGEIIHKLDNQTDSVEKLAYLQKIQDANGTFHFLASLGLTDNIIKIWNVETGKQIRILEIGNLRGIRNLASVNGGIDLLIAGYNSEEHWTYSTWNWAEQKSVQSYFDQGFSSFAILSIGESLVLSVGLFDETSSLTMVLYDYKANKITRRWELNTGMFFMHPITLGVIKGHIVLQGFTFANIGGDLATGIFVSIDPVIDLQ